MLKYGIVGIGNRAKSLIRAAEATGEVEIAAFADVNRQSREHAKRLLPNAKAFENVCDLLNHGGLDALIVSTPNHQHTEAVLAALDAGLHVFCEKPMAPSPAEWDRMIAKAKQSGKILQIGMELRYSPIIRDMEAMVRQGLIGNVKMAWCHEFRPPFRPGVGDWRHSQSSSGGSLLEKNCHHFDIFNYISGSRPVSVRAVGSNDTIYGSHDILDRSWVIVEYENGMQGNLGLCLFYHRSRLEVGFMGDEGSIEYFAEDEKVVVDTRAKQSVHHYHVDSQGYEKGGFDHPGEIEQQLAFIRSIRNGEPPLTDGETARWSQLVSLAGEESIRTGRTMRIEKDGTIRDASQDRI